MNFEKNVRRAADVFAKDWAFFITAGVIVCVLGTFTLGILMFPLAVGLGAAFLKAEKGRKPEYKDLFIYIHIWFKMAVMVLLILILVSFGFGLLVIPGLLLSALWLYSGFAMAMGKNGIIDSMKASWKIVSKKGLWEHVLMLFVLGFINTAASAFVFGLLITLPLTTGFLAMSFTEKSK